MEIAEILSIVATIIGALGGFELIKYLINRKSNARTADAEADSAEFNALREYNEYLQKCLTEKEERFTKQTERLRKTQDDYFALMKEKAQADLELQKYRCVRPKCAQREPQNGF